MSESVDYDINPEFMAELQRDNEIYNRPASESTGHKDGDLYKAADVRKAAEEVIQKLGGFVKTWELCGGVRRGNPMVHDGDIVLWTAYDIEPETMMNFQAKLASILKDQYQDGNVRFMEESLTEKEEGKGKKRKVRKATKPKPARKIYRFRYNGIPLEIYVVKNERQFEVLKLIRTGSHTFITFTLLAEANRQNMTIKFSDDENWGETYGLYGASQIWQDDKVSGRRKHVWVINPLRLIAWSEREIIETVLGGYVEPQDRN